MEIGNPAHPADGWQGVLKAFLHDLAASTTSCSGRVATSLFTSMYSGARLRPRELQHIWRFPHGRGGHQPVFVGRRITFGKIMMVHNIQISVRSLISHFCDESTCSTGEFKCCSVFLSGTVYALAFECSHVHVGDRILRLGVRKPRS